MPPSGLLQALTGRQAHEEAQCCHPLSLVLECSVRQDFSGPFCFHLPRCFTLLMGPLKLHPAWGLPWTILEAIPAMLLKCQVLGADDMLIKCLPLQLCTDISLFKIT